MCVCFISWHIGNGGQSTFFAQVNKDSHRYLVAKGHDHASIFPSARK